MVIKAWRASSTDGMLVLARITSALGPSPPGGNPRAPSSASGSTTDASSVAVRPCSSAAICRSPDSRVGMESWGTYRQPARSRNTSHSHAAIRAVDHAAMDRLMWGPVLDPSALTSHPSPKPESTSTSRQSPCAPSTSSANTSTSPRRGDHHSGLCALGCLASPREGSDSGTATSLLEHDINMSSRSSTSARSSAVGVPMAIRKTGPWRAEGWPRGAPAQFQSAVVRAPRLALCECGTSSLVPPIACGSHWYAWLRSNLVRRC